MKKILIIEDELNIFELIKFNLEAQGFEVAGFHEGTGAVEKIVEQRPDLIILDLMLPGKDGLTICREVRADKNLSYIPVIMLTAKSEEFDKVLGLEMGADDYMTKPFSVKELYARVKAVLRRTEMIRSSDTEELVVGSLRILPGAFEVYKNNKKLSLTLKEYELLLYLANNKNKVLTRDQLLDEIWGYEYYGETRTVDVHIRYLRKKIEDEREKYIETVRGVGYRLVENLGSDQ
ncbi:response regulator transcription factor [Eubacterium sp. 1001713B170207_170306_E7]|uniref:response regulator transcription factor n=1 Tax=Eubacterium sp. 1001713B170207_170306_E7 TaxID=2787097 RepID=UPI00189743A1|nr:response regulator transcription factor [Eubacterium sp. 1001713B170207_170306_E7]